MINFAHGDIFMVGAYFGCFTITQYRRLVLQKSILLHYLTFIAGALGQR